MKQEQETSSYKRGSLFLKLSVSGKLLNAIDDFDKERAELTFGKTSAHHDSTFHPTFLLEPRSGKFWQGNVLYDPATYTRGWI